MNGTIPSLLDAWGYPLLFHQVGLDSLGERALAVHLTRVHPGPADLVFPGECQTYWKVRRVWHRVLRAASIPAATIHDARHTFGVHRHQAGVPIVRLQRLLGHATAAMAMRYMRHAQGRTSTRTVRPSPRTWAARRIGKPRHAPRRRVGRFDRHEPHGGCPHFCHHLPGTLRPSERAACGSDSVW